MIRRKFVYMICILGMLYSFTWITKNENKLVVLLNSSQWFIFLLFFLVKLEVLHSREDI